MADDKHYSVRQGKHIPAWLHKTGAPIFWTFRNVASPRIVNRGVVRFHRAKRVYITGDTYGLWVRAEDIEEIKGHNDGDYLL